MSFETPNLPPPLIPLEATPQVEIIPADQVNDLTPMIQAGPIGHSRGQALVGNREEWLNHFIEYPVLGAIGTLAEHGIATITSSANYINVDGNYGGPAHIGFLVRVDDKASQTLSHKLQATLEKVRASEELAAARFSVEDVPLQGRKDVGMLLLELGVSPDM